MKRIAPDEANDEIEKKEEPPGKRCKNQMDILREKVSSLESILKTIQKNPPQSSQTVSTVGITEAVTAALTILKKEEKKANNNSISRVKL